MKKILIYTIFVLSVSSLFAQQDAQFTQYMFNPQITNAAFAGSSDALSLTMIGRKQWLNIDGAPTSGAFSLSAPINKQSLALGMTLIYDQIGARQNVGIAGDIAYRIKLNSRGSKLAFGLKPSMDFFSANFSDKYFVNYADATIYGANIPAQMLPNVGFGIYMYGRRHFISASAPKLLENTLSQDAALVMGDQRRHFFFSAGYAFKLNSIWDLAPTIGIKAVENSPIAPDLSLSLIYNQKLWLGIMTRFDDPTKIQVGSKLINEISGILGLKIGEKFRIGYAYDYNMSELSQITSGSHEVMLGYDLGLFKEKSIRPNYFYR